MSTNNNPGGPGQEANDLAAASKRAALAGQWRTPPMPVYPTGSTAQPAPAPPLAPVPQENLPTTASMPTNSDEYAKALQEAYRKGAEAAARMAQQPGQQPQHPQQQSMSNAASCPDFSASPETQGAYQVHAIPTSIPDPLATSSMPPPPPQPPHYASSSQPPPTLSSAPQPVHHAPAPPPHASYHAPPAPHYATAPPGPTPVVALSQPPKPPSGRSMSMPDMATYAAAAEEEKRQKRLARNRQSARLRRQRKKNLVDAYETEVGILEKTLKQLKAHEWGADDNHQALIEALGMERGQQSIAPDQRAAIIRDILQHQQQQVQVLRQAQMEQECLALLASNPEDELAKELQEVLQLSPDQLQSLQESSQGLEQEIQALETIAASLQAMQENDWLINEGVNQITDQCTSILHKNQLSKFLLWADANVEAIDQLDHVTVQPLQGAPLFTFGVETTPDNEEKEG